MLKPWRRLGGTRSSKYKSIWDGRLQRLSRQRDKSYIRALKQNDVGSWNEHERLDREIKISLYGKKRALRRQEISAMLGISMPRTQSWIKNQIRGSNSNCNTTTRAGAPLNPVDFTAHVCKKPGEVTMVAPKHFTFDENFQENIEGTISRLSNGSAAGSDGIYYEMLKAASKETTICLTALWPACGRTAHTQMDWGTGLLVPIFKMGDPEIPSNYMPICLLSSLRKVMERTLDKEVQAHYVPNAMQMGFQAKMGTKMAIAQTVQAMKGGQKWTAVRDLTSPYDTVRRDLLFERCAKVLPGHKTAMISHTLQTLTVTTVGDYTKTEAKIDRGVTQGGPASPTLFNIFIDTFANALQQHLWNPNTGLLAHLYAADVILHVKSVLDLQRVRIIF